jgi:hypothetical protein
LVPGGLRVDDATSIDDTDDAAYAEMAYAWVPLDLYELCTERVAGEVLAVGVGAVASGLPFSVGAGEIGELENLLKGDTGVGCLIFEVNAT